MSRLFSNVNDVDKNTWSYSENHRYYTRVLEIRPSFWFDPQVSVAHANKNVAILFEF